MADSIQFENPIAVFIDGDWGVLAGNPPGLHPSGGPSIISHRSIVSFMGSSPESPVFSLLLLLLLFSLMETASVPGETATCGTAPPGRRHSFPLLNKAEAVETWSLPAQLELLPGNSPGIATFATVAPFPLPPPKIWQRLIPAWPKNLPFT